MITTVGEALTLTVGSDEVSVSGMVSPTSSALSMATSRVAPETVPAGKVSVPLAAV